MSEEKKKDFVFTAAMTFPVRCLCNAVIGKYYQRYEKMILANAGDPYREIKALDALKITKICCRTRFLSFVPELGEHIFKYQIPAQRIEDTPVVSTKDS